MSVVRIQLRRDSAANWTAANPILASGEFGYDTTAGDIKVGDGVTAWADLSVYQPSSVQFANEAAALQTARTINGVSFDGTANITVAAAAGTLTGTALASNVITSSLTAVGTIATGVWQGTAIVDTYLATIATAGKVANSATTAASTNTASAIVARDGSGNFSAGTITAALAGNATTATTLASARTIWGQSFDGSGNVTGSLSGVVALGMSGTLTMTATASKIVPGATSFAVRNNADSADNLLVTDAGAVTVRNGLTVTAGGTSLGGALTYGGVTLSNAVTGTGNMVLSASPTFTGTVTAAAVSLSGTLTMTTAASKLVPGATSFSHRNNADSADNLLISDAGVVTVRAGLTVTAGTTSLGGALTYGGVTLSAAVTGTGNMVLSASPTMTGTTTVAGLTISGTISFIGTKDLSGIGNLAASGTLTLTASGTSIAASGDITVATTKKHAMNAGATTYLAESATDTLDTYVSGNHAFRVKYGATRYTQFWPVVAMTLINIGDLNIAIPNGTAPSGNPTGGGFVWVESGAFKYRGPSGTVTTIAPA